MVEGWRQKRGRLGRKGGALGSGGSPGGGEGSRAGKPEVGLHTLEKQSDGLEGNFLTVKKLVVEARL